MPVQPVKAPCEDSTSRDISASSAVITSYSIHYTKLYDLISQVVTGVLAAYGFSKGKFKAQKFLFLLVLGALMIPLQVTFIPLYIMFANWKLTDTFLGLILPEMVSPYFIFMMRQAFLTVDDSYIEAAKLVV